MALFKISYGLASKLSNQQITEGYCWFTPDDGKFYIDHKDSNGNVVRTPLNAAVASAVAWSGVTGKPEVVTGYSKGGATVPVYTNAAGELQAGTTYAGGTKVKLNNSDSYGGTTATFYAPTAAGTTGQLLVSTGGAPTWQNVSAHGTHVSYSSSNPAALGTASPGTAATVARSDHIHALPALTACTGTLTVAKGGTGATDAATARSNLGITPDNIGAAKASHGTHVSYGTSTANLGTASAGTASTVSRSDHVHKMPTYSDVGAAAASHGTHVTTATVKSALGTGSGTTKFLREDGSWATPAYYTLTKAKVEAVLTGEISSHTHSQLYPDSTLAYGRNLLQYFNASLGTTVSATANYAPTADWYHIIRMNHGNAQGYCVDIAACFHSDNLYLRRLSAGTNYGYKHIWVEGNSITGAVWNDYAEYRESDCAEFGRVLMENGDDTLSITTDRLQPFAGVSSDTWGFCQGKTEKAKTPIAVAGRVLAYPYQNRDNYKPGDCVCSAPNGTVDIMTREEVIMYPDRIIGTVSCVPNYETWGSGDRDPVQVDGRIWIKVK